MADRRKATLNTVDHISQDTDKQFLEKNNVHGIMKDILTKLITHRPEDPIKFIANFFETTTDDEPTDLVNRAVHMLNLTHHSRPMFETNMQSAFDILSKYRINKKLQGINGTVLSLLLHALCKNFPSVIMIRLFKRLQCFEYEAVTYDIFRSSVFTCCVLQEYVTIAEKLFHSLDIQKTWKADKNLCESALEQLRTALTSSQPDVRRILESSYRLSPDGLSSALDKAMTRKTMSGFYTKEQFVLEACEPFLTKVKRLK